MRKIYCFFLFLLIAKFGFGQTTYSYTFSTSATQFSTSPQTISLGAASWILTNNGGYYGYDATKGQQIGSSGSPASSMSLTTTSFTCPIQSVIVTTSGASGITASVSVSVGGTSYGTQAITSTSTSYTFTGSSTGQIKISWNNTSSKALYIYDISVIYNCISSNITTGAVSPTTFALGNCTNTATGTVAFTSSGTFNAGCVFTAELSNYEGSFASPVNIGTYTIAATTTNPSGTINIIIPAASLASSLYQIEIISSNPSVTGSVSATFTVTGCTSPSCSGNEVIAEYNSDTYTTGLTSINGTQDNAVTISSIQVSNDAAVNEYCDASFSECSYYQITAASTAAPYVFCHTTTPNVSTSPDYFYFTITPLSGYVMTISDIQITCGSFGTSSSSGPTKIILGYQEGSSPWVTSPVYDITPSKSGGGSSGSDTPDPVTVPGNDCANMQTFVWSLSPYLYTGNTLQVRFFPYDATNCDCSTDEFGFTQLEVDGPCEAVVLPINLLFFTANNQADNAIQLNWTTATETNSDYFEIQYALDGKTFYSYKQVKAAGNSTETKNYSCPFTLDIGNQTPYFRLKEVDIDGNFKFSQIITLGGAKANILLSSFNSYYNTDNTSIMSKFKLDAPSQVSFTLYDVTGSQVYASTNQFVEGDNQFSIPAPDQSGVYVLVYQNGSNAPVRKKVAVTK